MGEVIVLRPDEGIRLNPERLVALYAELGERGAEAVLARALDEREQRRAERRGHAEAGSGAALERSARLLVKVAEQIGMESFARVAGDVAFCAGARDAIGQAATLGRLSRIGDRSLTAVWKLRDVMI